MYIKSQLRSLLGDLLVKHPIDRTRSRVANKQAIKYITVSNIDPQLLPVNARGPEVGAFLRILASDTKNAEQIAEQVRKHQEDLQVESVHVLNGALDHRNSPEHHPTIFHKSVLLKLNRKSFLKSTLKPITTTDGLAGPILAKEILDCEQSSKRLVIDFSSPNIAKPFHFGHLKSTILGNFLSNINRFVGNDVVRLNYIGDWGTQYGLLNLGLAEDKDFLSSIEPSGDNYGLLRHLVDIYVEANEKGRKDDSFYERAKQKLQELESDPKQRAKWQRIRDISLEELKKSYTRLNIEFDVHEFESDYVKRSGELVEVMKKLDFVRIVEDGHVVAKLDKNLKEYEVPIQRSDGASLYLTRDISAALARKEKYNFDKMLYIVGSDQERHFHSLKEIIRRLGHDWHTQLEHVQIGKVKGMSTRKGNFVLLSEIIDNMIEEYIESTKRVVTSKVAHHDSELQTAAEHLALSALFISDMRNARYRSYEFDWSFVVKSNERSGINLQTTHARLCGLMKRAKEYGLEVPNNEDELTMDALCNSEAISLMSLIGEFDSKLHGAYWFSDSSHLVNYAFDLCKAINRARRSDKLWVIGQTNETWSRTRLALFNCARERLALIIRLLGLKPLDKV